jgi:hypothetical protein
MKKGAGVFFPTWDEATPLKGLPKKPVYLWERRLAAIQIRLS